MGSIEPLCMTETWQRSGRACMARMSHCSLLLGSIGSVSGLESLPPARSARRGEKLLAVQKLDQGGAERGRVRRNPDAGSLHGLDLGVRAALAARDDRAGMAHAAA